MKPRSLNRLTLDDYPLPPIVDGDKESKGRILIVAGSRQIPGAALLAAQGAMRAGAGKLRIATGQSVAVEIGVSMPEAMVVGFQEDEDGGLMSSASDALGEQAATVDAVIAGPGMARSDACARIAATLLQSAPAVAFDAALLHALKPPERDRSPLPILLPHRGELASLLDCDEAEIEVDPVGCGLRAAQRYRAIVLVKGVTSHIVTPQAEAWSYAGGAPGLGVSGSGDVLAGIVGGLLARGADPLNALLWTVWLHGEAGTTLAAKVGPIGFLAREIAEEVPLLMTR